jgi:hypothetical protein
LNEEEVLAKNLGERYKHKRELGVKKDVRGGSEEIDIESGFAEKHACDEFGCKFNSEILDGNDGGYDFIYKNNKVDVKWLGFLKGTKEPRKAGRIIVDLHKINRADIFIAVSGSRKNSFKSIGWCTQKDLLNHARWKSDFPDENGEYWRYAIHSKELKDIEQLKNIPIKKDKK